MGRLISVIALITFDFQKKPMTRVKIELKTFTSLNSTTSVISSEVPTPASYFMMGFVKPTNCGPDLQRVPTGGGISRADTEARADHTLNLSVCSGSWFSRLNTWMNMKASVDSCGISQISFRKLSSM